MCIEKYVKKGRERKHLILLTPTPHSAMQKRKKEECILTASKSTKQSIALNT